MTEKRFDYRVIGLKCHMGFDYMENDTFEEFYLKIKELSDEYGVHIKSAVRHDDIVNYTEKGGLDNE